MPGLCPNLPRVLDHDGTFALSTDELGQKFLIEKERSLSLDAFLPRRAKNWKAQRSKALPIASFCT